LFSGAQREVVGKVQALLSLVREKYFIELMKVGYHVLHTIPVWKLGGSALSWAPTSITFRICSDTVITRKTLKGRSNGDEPVIVIVGMTGGRSFPPSITRPDFTAEWMVHLGRAMRSGAVCFSRDTFLDGKLLGLFARVNAMTTMIPFFTGVNGKNWGLRLVPWAEDEDRKYQSSAFRLEDLDRALGLRYKWQHQARWTYEQLGSTWSSQQRYIARCLSSNINRKAFT
jgi:hypothetical protein